MRKLLGVSIAAMLAVSPMMAKAELSQFSGVTNSGTTTKIATTSYVKGAYNKAIEKANTIVDALALPANKTYDSTDKISKTNSVGQNIDALNTAIKTVSNSSSGAVGAEAERAAQAEAGLQSQIAGEGTLTNLNTEAKGNLVAAINEVDANADAAQAAANAAQASANLRTVTNGATYSTVTDGTNSVNVYTTTQTDAKLQAITDKYIPLYGDWESDDPTGSVQINTLGTTNPIGG